MPRADAELALLPAAHVSMPAEKVERSDARRSAQPLPVGAALCDALLFGGSLPLLGTGTSTATPVGGSCRQFVRKQHRLYGTRLLLFLIIVNLLYGVTTSWFIYLNNYYLAADFGLTPAQTQSAVATMGLCIIVRPILGSVSDSVPIRGSTRRAYFLLAGAGSSCCYLALAVLKPHAQLSPWSATALLCIANVLGYAWCGVILYAIVAEEQRRDPVDGAANLNALQWGCYSSGALLGDLSEGFLLEMAAHPHQCYWMMFLLWGVMAACSMLYEERRQSGAQAPAQLDAAGASSNSASNSATELTGRPPGKSDASCQNAPELSERPIETLADASVELQPPLANTDTVERAHSSSELDCEAQQQARNGPDPVCGTKIHGTGVEENGFVVQMKKLWIALDPKGPTEGVILLAVLYIFLTWALVPDVSSGVTYFFYTGSHKVGGLGFGAVTYSMLSVVGDVAMLGASYIYGAYLGSTPLRRLFISLQLLNVVASALDLVLALRWNEAIGVDATVFAGIDQAIFYCAWQLKNLPVYTLAAKLCPPGVEATLTAGIAGLNDLSGALAQFFGAWLTSACGVSGTRLENVWLVYIMRTLCKLLPIPLVVLVPTEERLDGALRRLNKRLSIPQLHGSQQDDGSNSGPKCKDDCS